MGLIIDDIVNKRNLFIGQKGFWLPENPYDKILVSLAERERLILLLSTIEKYSEEETAKTLSAEPAKVKEELQQAYGKLLEEFKGKKIEEVLAEIASLEKDIEPKKDLWQEVYHFINKKEGKDTGETVTEVKLDIPEKKLTFREKREKRKKEKATENFYTTNEGILSRLPLRLIFTIIAVAAVIGIFLYLVLSGDKWQIRTMSGSPTFEGKPVENSAVFSEGSELKTNKSSAALIMIPGIGHIEINHDSRVIRPPAANSLRVEEGEIVVSKSGAEQRLTVETPAGLVEDIEIGGSYILRVDPSVSVVRVNSSWVKVISEKKEAIVIEGYFCEFKKSIGPGIPYSASASEDLKEAVRDFSFSGGTDEALNRILYYSRTEDAFSLWSLFERLHRNKRTAVLERLENLIPLPPPLKRSDVLRVHKSTMNQWLEKISEEI